MKRFAYPFLTLDERAVTFAGWFAGPVKGVVRRAPEIMEHWDYHQDIQVEVELSVDLAEAARQLGLPAQALQLQAALSMGTGAGRLPRRMTRLCSSVLDEGRHSVRLDAICQGYELSSRLWLELSVSLLGPEHGGNGLSPARKGARLWDAHHDMLLEGGGASRFPVELVSFSSTFPGRSFTTAPWFFFWRRGFWEADFGGSVRLYINDDMPLTSERFALGDAATLQAILADAMTQIIGAMLDEDGCEALLAGADDGSVAAQARNWLGLAFPLQNMETIRSLRTQQPGQFHAAILAAADPGETK